MSLKYGALFAGYGGLEMGAQQVIPGELAWYSEIDKGALKVLSHRFPGVPNLGDITAVDWSKVEPVDVLTGGSPCQDLSHAGKRQGMTEGTRSNLWVAMREAIAQLRPSLVIWENVRGAGSAEADSDLVNRPRLLAGVRRRPGQPVLRALGRVVGDLSDLGYVGRVRGLLASEVGACHGRFRYFIAAHASGGGRDWRAQAQVGRQVRRTATAGAGPLLPSPRTSDANGVGAHGEGGLDLRTAVAMLPTPRVASTRTSRAALTRQGHWSAPSLDQAIELASGVLPREYRDWSGVQGNQPSTWGDYAAAIHRWETLTRPAPAPTEQGPKGNRRLSAAFSEWMMGLPAGWVTDVPGITRNEALRALGNGVVPQQASAAIRWMLAASEVAA